MTRTTMPSWTLVGRHAGTLPLRGKRVAKDLIKSSIAKLVLTMPGVAYRVAAYVEHTVSQQPRVRKVQPATASAPKRASKRAAIEDLLLQSGPTLDHAEVLEMLHELGQLREATLHRYLSGLFAARRLDVMVAVIGRTALGYPVTRLFHQLKLQQYRGVSASSPDEIADHYQRLRAHPLYADAALNLAVDGLVRLGDAAALAQFLREIPSDAFSRIAPATFLGSFRLLEQSGAAARLEGLRHAYLSGLAPEQRLFHLEIMPATMTERALAERDWRSVLSRFAASYSAPDPADRDLIERLVFEPLRRLPTGERDFMNIRFDPSQRERLFGIILAALKGRTPLSLVRLGDGEGYGYAVPTLAGLPIERCVDDNAIRERMWWGSNIGAADRARLTAGFRQAIAEADIIGMPSIYRIIRDRGTPGTRYGETGGQRGLAVVLAQLGDGIPLSARFTEERCHQLLFHRASIEQLIAAADRVVLVSCWRRDQLGLADAGTDIREIVIPPHTKVADATGHQGQNSLAETFDTQVADMAAHCAPGTLVLVGAGFIGKIFLGAARARGAVGLDVGAVLDYMAGYKTRSLADLA